ncbi:MAG: rhamnogalacturonan acetylesterase [Bacteroidales bacterium]|nr:rhamnogalacturonan acetylesterase [Bacteroidales bacterium]
MKFKVNIKKKKFFSFIFLIAGFLMVVSFSGTKKINIWMIGDSTMATKSELRFPESGWGEALQEFVTENTTVHNHAVNGRSTKSYIDEGRWNKIYDSIQAGDYVVIQFGHNDEKPDTTRHTDPFTGFKANIRKFIEDTRSKGAYPIVCSSIVRRHFDSQGNLKDTHGDYIVAAKEIAKETQTPYIDMESLTRQLVTEMGPEKSKTIYNFCKPGEYPNFEKGKLDSTHLNVYGAKVVAKLFIDEVKFKRLSLSEMFR